MTPAGAGSSRCPDADAAARDRRVGDRGARHPRARADGARRRAGWRELVARAAPERPRSRSSAARATTAATASSPRGCCASTGRDVDVLLLGAAEELQGDARANLERLPGRAAAAVRAPSGLDGRRGDRRRDPRHRASRASRASPRAGAIEAINAAGASRGRVACDVPSGVDASTGEVAGAAVRADATATFHAAKPGPVDRPGQGARRRGHGGRHRHPAGRPGRARASA